MGDTDVDLGYSTGWQQARFFLYLLNYWCKTIDSLAESGPSVLWASADTWIHVPSQSQGGCTQNGPNWVLFWLFIVPGLPDRTLSPHRVCVDSVSLLFQTRGLINLYLNKNNPIFMDFLKLRWNCGFENWGYYYSHYRQNRSGYERLTLKWCFKIYPLKISYGCTMNFDHICPPVSPHCPKPLCISSSPQQNLPLL